MLIHSNSTLNLEIASKGTLTFRQREEGGAIKVASVPPLYAHLWYQSLLYYCVGDTSCSLRRMARFNVHTYAISFKGKNSLNI